MAYYFLVAQLPYLSAQAQKPPMTAEAFRAMCAEHLTARELAELDKLDPGYRFGEEKAGDQGSGFFAAWQKREADLEYAMAKLRAAKLKRDMPGEARAVPHEIENEARTAFAMENPLEAELYLDKGRWEFAEALAGLDYFGVNVLYAYRIKLLLLERRQAFQAGEGLTEYEALYEKILKMAPGRAAAGDMT
ncbi:MAG: DUF2764 domain-containing protein [Fusobacteriaceae bacterium]|nr:DUF2764 domain-containing protein [Fusobacteriaceae bacterium]